MTGRDSSFFSCSDFILRRGGDNISLFIISSLVDGESISAFVDDEPVSLLLDDGSISLVVEKVRR